MACTTESFLEYELADENTGFGSKLYTLYLIPIKKHRQSVDLSFYPFVLHSKVQRTTI